MHVGVNAIWLLPFGAAMARRFGALRFLGFFAVTAIAGAALHLVTHWARAAADDRRFRCGIGHDGGLAAFHLPGRRAARHVPHRR